jgi:NADH dehydrogenase
MEPAALDRHRVFVTGATGFVGRAVVHALRAHGHFVRCLVRRGSERDLRGLEAIERVEGDILARTSLEGNMAGCDVVVHLVGIIREHPAARVTFERVHTQGTVKVMEAATAAGVRRFVHMSALGTRAEARSRYHQTKWAAEEVVRSSGLAWTIYRPSIIYGRGDGFVSLLARMVRRLPVVPVLGPGTEEMQPIPVEHVAEAFARALTLPATVKQTLEAGGPERVTVPRLLDLIAEALGRRARLKMHVPMDLVRLLAALRLPGFPVTPDQLRMLEENNTCDADAFYASVDLTPLPLRAGLARMLRP